ncbi:precorrin-6A synthase (deacetylating) [Umezawaea sp.]|uniref:precorrin-6A synthase (deacetylating) n=1 Tax=Umezawaea sp. TaxID=1955258 RepID=UPI002ED27144
MKQILLIGIGAGDPDYVTIQAVKALNRVDVFFVLDKGEVKQDLVDVRQEILDRHVERDYRVVEARDPDRDRTTPAYAEAVHDWRRRRADVCEELIRTELEDGQTGAFLVWGDPALYDSTLAIVEDILARGGVEFDYEVVPGITSVQALVAKHRTSLNRVGRPVQITTGRRLAEGFPADVDDVVVMLDAHNSFTGVDDDVHVYWGAYVGTPDELLISGPVGEVGERIAATRAEARERKGWIMDTYLLRRKP